MTLATFGAGRETEVAGKKLVGPILVIFLWALEMVPILQNFFSPGSPASLEVFTRMRSRAEKPNPHKFEGDQAQIEGVRATPKINFGPLGFSYTYPVS